MCVSVCVCVYVYACVNGVKSPSTSLLSLDKGLLSTTGIFFSFLLLLLLLLTLSIRRALTITTNQLSPTLAHIWSCSLFSSITFSLSLILIAFFRYTDANVDVCACVCVAGPISITLNDLLFTHYVQVMSEHLSWRFSAQSSVQAFCFFFNDDIIIES